MKLPLFYICLFLSGHVFSQGFPTLKSYEKEVVKFEQRKDYPTAYAYYADMIEFDKNSELYHYKAAMMAMKMKAYETADSHLEHLDTLGFGEEFREIQYWRGQAALATGRYEDAQNYFTIFISENENDALSTDEKVDSTLVKRAKIMMESADWALTQEPDSLVKLDHLGETINSPYSDFGATHLDGPAFLYSSDRDLIKKDDYPIPRKVSHIYYSPDGESGGRVQGDINRNTEHSSHTALSPDGKTLYYTICNFLENSTEIRCDIYSRSFDLDSMAYGPAKKLPEGVNMAGFTTTQPNCALTADSTAILLFASDRPGGKGKTDIWYVEIIGQDQFGPAVNLDSLNTEEEEWSPFLHHGDQELYFSSKGYLGFGSLDIYKARWNGQQTQGPTNLGSPVNSSYDDVYYALSEDGYQAYMASNRENSYFIDTVLKACCFDLYEVTYIPPPIELLVTVFDVFDTSAVNMAEVRLIDLESGEEMGRVASNDPNDYTFDIQHFKDYRIISSRPGYLPDTLDFDTDDLRGVEIIEKQLYLTKEVPLAVTVWDENTGEPILGATVKLFEKTDSTSQLLATMVNDSSHVYNFTLVRGKEYEVFGTRELYDSSTVLVAGVETSLGQPLEKEIDLVRLAIRNLEKVFPLVLFFDNDQPDPKTKKRTTDRIYQETYREYMSRKDEFIKKYTTTLGGTSYGEQADREIKSFFIDEVEHGYNKLNYFMEQLHGVLIGGLLVEVSIKGYTSPIAKGDYNLRLSQRRVECLKNEFLSWEGGKLQKFVDSGTLVLKEVPFGESKAPEGLSDSAMDRRNSVYSPLASRERRVEVIAVRRMAQRAKVNVN